MLTFDDIRDPFTSEIVEIDGLPVVVPILGVKATDEVLKLHWWNSTVLLFDNRELNHVEYKQGDQPKKGIRFDPDMIGLFREMQYPTYFRPLPDEATLKWYSQIAVGNLDAELDGFEG